MRSFKNILSFLACFTLIFFVSCSEKKEESPEPLPNQITPITSCRILGASTWDPIGVKLDSTHRIYDSSGRLAEIEFVNTLSKYKITYNQTGQIDKILDRYGYDFERRFYNASGQLYKITHTNSWVVDSIDRKTFQYDNSGKIVSSWLKKFAKPSSGTIEQVFFTKYFYNNKGLLTLDSTFYVANGQYFFNRRTIFEFDEKPGVGIMDFQGWYDESLYLFAPLTHNIVSRIHKQKTIGGEIEENYTLKYEYNALGYPTKIDIYHNGGLWSIKKIWYECF